MNCAELDKRMEERGQAPSTTEIHHLRRCKRCLRKYGLDLLLPLHITGEFFGDLSLAPEEEPDHEAQALKIQRLSLMTTQEITHKVREQETFKQDLGPKDTSTPVPGESSFLKHLEDTLSGKKLAPAPGEEKFLARLERLGEEQSDAFFRAQTLHEQVHRGDRLFWRGEYGQAARHYREALMVVRDDQGRVALQNKLARVQMHRHRSEEAITLLCDGLLELGEPAPPERFQSAFLLLEQLSFWLLMLVAWLQSRFPKLFPPTVRYGDRSRAAQNLYRELSILSQGQDEHLSRWAHLREMRWALLLKQPMVLAVAWGRHAVKCAQREQNILAQLWIHRMLDVAKDSDPLTQASAHFYLGRVSYIQGRWEDARFHLECCVEASHSSQDAYLKDAALQHLIRVYRNDGNFAEAVRVASQLLALYHKLGNLPRISACCRHFALIYASYGVLRQALAWSSKALHIASDEPIQSDERALSLLRCYILQGDLELRRGRPEVARRFIGAAIGLQREHGLRPEFLRDGLQLLRRILGEEILPARVGPLRKASRWLASKWAVMSGDLERAHHLQQSSRVGTGEHAVPQEMAYLFQEYAGPERTGGIREAIPASDFALSFLQGQVSVRPTDAVAEREADQVASMFPVGAVSSRWGRGALTRDRTGAITTQFSNGSEAPWGYFFADDIG